MTEISKSIGDGFKGTRERRRSIIKPEEEIQMLRAQVSNLPLGTNTNLVIHLSEVPKIWSSHPTKLTPINVKKRQKIFK